MLTKTEASTLRSGQTIYSGTQTNRDGSPLRVRVTGATKTWKTRPGDFRVPVRYGLRENGAITHRNNAVWYVSEAAAVAAIEASRETLARMRADLKKEATRREPRSTTFEAEKARALRQK